MLFSLGQFTSDSNPCFSDDDEIENIRLNTNKDDYLSIEADFDDNVLILNSPEQPEVNGVQIPYLEIEDSPEVSEVIEKNDELILDISSAVNIEENMIFSINGDDPNLPFNQRNRNLDEYFSKPATEIEVLIGSIRICGHFICWSLQSYFFLLIIRNIDSEMLGRLSNEYPEYFLQTLKVLN